MEDVRLVKVIHQEDAPQEMDLWMQRLIVRFLTNVVQANPKDIGELLRVIDSQRGDSSRL